MTGQGEGLRRGRIPAHRPTPGFQLGHHLMIDCLAGRPKGIEFMGSRDVELKGLEGSHRLFAVDLG